MKKSDNKDRISLYRAILSLESINECAALLSDLFSESELDMINQRFSIAKMLTMGMNYSGICTLTGASTATVCRINKTLLYGNGGYALTFEKEIN